MAANMEDRGGRNRMPWRLIGWGSATLILLGHLVAMQFTSEVNWSLSDFAFAAALMGAVGIGGAGSTEGQWRVSRGCWCSARGNVPPRLDQRRRGHHRERG